MNKTQFNSDRSTATVNNAAQDDACSVGMTDSAINRRTTLVPPTPAPVDLIGSFEALPSRKIDLRYWAAALVVSAAVWIIFARLI